MTRRVWAGITTRAFVVLSSVSVLALLAEAGHKWR